MHPETNPERDGEEQAEEERFLSMTAEALFRIGAWCMEIQPKLDS